MHSSTPQEITPGEPDMHKRTTFRDQLKQAWKSTIEEHYNAQLINSEHGLQTYFFIELRKQFEGTNRQIYIEPQMRFAKDLRRHPDLVICDSEEIIGIVELKYKPRGRAEHVKDVETLRLAVEYKDTLTISNDRFLGVVANDKRYPLSASAVLCWAAVYTGRPIALKDPTKVAESGHHFLQLDARTAAGKIAVIT